MPFRQEPAARIDPDLDTASRWHAHNPHSSLAFCKKAKIFAVDNFCDRETIVQFGDIDIVGPDASNFVSTFGSAHRAIVRGDVIVIRDACRTIDQYRSGDAHSWSTVMFGQHFAGEYQCSGTVGRR